MDLTFNRVIRITAKEDEPFESGIYRVLLDEPILGQAVIVKLLSPSDAPKSRGGRKKAPKSVHHRKKRSPPLCAKLLWPERENLRTAWDDGRITVVEIERENIPDPTPKERSSADYQRRIRTMEPFLDFKRMRESILGFRGLQCLVQEAMSASCVSRAYVYRQFSNLCLWGFDEKSLMPRRDRCGAPGILRPCDPGGRKKAGAKTIKQRLAKQIYGIDIDPDQPGMSTEWRAAILAADATIPTPKPAMEDRTNLIINSRWVTKYRQQSNEIVPVTPDQGTYPLVSQISRVLRTATSRIQRLIERTTKRHFERNMRGFNGRNWEGVSGPGHTYAIDSTVGDIYLRSGLNRAWIVGRPIVYIIVDIWSTAVVGFYVCLTGPSWHTAKTSLFNVAADPTLLGDLWGYQPILTLNPRPTLSYELLCDHGEYLSKGHRVTATKLIPHTSYAPPYAGDLKGLVEVLHRIEKDAQYLFLPGAMDARRAEYELRRVNPDDCVLTVREYVQYLYQLFVEYNLAAKRERRLDAHMKTQGVFPSPAGLWHWGHEVGLGYRKHNAESVLITELLPSDVGHVVRDGVRFAGNFYTNDVVKEEQWTTEARNFGMWKPPINYYPGSVSRIWTPNFTDKGLLSLNISDQANASKELTYDELAESIAIQCLKRPEVAHERLRVALEAIQRGENIVEAAKKLTAEALDKAKGATPTMTEARQMEVAAQSADAPSETKTTEKLRDEAMDAHLAMLKAVVAAANKKREE